MRWWRSRWVVVPGLLVIVVLGWNAYVWTHDGGLIQGSVIDSAGHPVPGADVTLYARSFVTNDARQRTQTDAFGHFRFTGNASHALQLEAQASGLGHSARVTVRLLFAGENIKLRTPLRLGATS